MLNKLKLEAWTVRCARAIENIVSIKITTSDDCKAELGLGVWVRNMEAEFSANYPSIDNNPWKQAAAFLDNFVVGPRSNLAGYEAEVENFKEDLKECGEIIISAYSESPSLVISKTRSGLCVEVKISEPQDCCMVDPWLTQIQEHNADTKYATIDRGHMRATLSKKAHDLGYRLLNPVSVNEEGCGVAEVAVEGTSHKEQLITAIDRGLLAVVRIGEDPTNYQSDPITKAIGDALVEHLEYPLNENNESLNFKTAHELITLETM